MQTQILDMPARVGRKQAVAIRELMANAGARITGLRVEVTMLNGELHLIDPDGGHTWRANKDSLVGGPISGETT